MTLQRKILATLATGLGMWVVAGLWHNVVRPSLYAQRHATHDGLGLLFVAYLSLAALMVYLLPSDGGTPTSIWYGLTYGAAIGVLWVFPHGLAMAGAHGEALDYVLKNSLWHIVEQGVGGVILVSVVGIRTGRLSSQSNNAKRVPSHL